MTTDGGLPQWAVAVTVGLARLEEKVDHVQADLKEHLAQHQHNPGNDWKKLGVFGLAVGAGVSGAGAGLIKALELLK